MLSTRYSCQILMKLGVFQQRLEKYSNNKFYDHLSIGSRVVPSEWTDRQTDG